MSWRSIAWASVLLVAGCAGGGSGDGELARGEVFKISYYRPHPHPRTRKPQATYKVVMSESWKDRVGESPREPLSRAAPGASYRGFVGDAEMARFIELLRAEGIETLRSSDPESYPPQELFRKATDPREADAEGHPFTRIITIGTDTWHRSYYYRDQQTDKELIQKFIRCEKLASQIVSRAIYTETEAPLTFPRDKK